MSSVKGKAKSKSSVSSIPDDMKEFITKKVKKLRSIKKTKAFYNRDDNVSKFAHKEADRLFRKKKRKGKKNVGKIQKITKR